MIQVALRICTSWNVECSDQLKLKMDVKTHMDMVVVYFLMLQPITVDIQGAKQKNSRKAATPVAASVRRVFAESSGKCF